MNTNSNARAGSDSKTLNSDANNENEHHNREGGSAESQRPTALKMCEPTQTLEVAHYPGAGRSL